MALSFSPHFLRCKLAPVLVWLIFCFSEVEIVWFLRFFGIKLKGIDHKVQGCSIHS